MKYLSPIIVLQYLLSMVTHIIQTLLGLRIILQLFGASATAPFVQWIYQTTQPLVSPFIGMFPSPEIESGFVIEFSAIFALLAYAILAYLLEELLAAVAFSSTRWHTPVHPE